MYPVRHSSSEQVERALLRSASPLTALAGHIPPVKLTSGYCLSLFIVATAMVLLPLIYVGLIALFAYVIYYHATHHQSLISSAGYGRVTVWMFVLYLVPIVAGGIMTIFLIKPLFARRPQENQFRSLSHQQAPLLFAFLGELCRAMNAPIPSRVDVDCEVNAAASFRGGFGSLLGRDLKLTIGLPLVAGLSLQQFAGVLAHEFGHFTQGAAMRVSYLVRSINFWFARVVYERDELDWWLIEQSEAGYPYISFLLYVARFGVGVSRSALWVLMTIGQAMSSFLLRQMEHDADAYERHLVGSKTFIETVRSLQRLNLASFGCLQHLKKMWQRDRRIYDSVPEFIASHARQIPADAQGRLYEEYLKRKTGLFDTHPSDKDRIRRAQEAEDFGVYHQTAPASALFTDFPELSRSITFELYEMFIGDDLKPEHLVSTASAFADAEDRYDADRTAVSAFFMGVATSLRPICLPDSRTFRDFTTLERDLKHSRQRMDELRPAALEALNAFKEADSTFMFANQASGLVEAGIAFDPADFSLPDANADTLQRKLKAAQESSDNAIATLKVFEAAAATRLGNALQLVRSIQTAPHLPDSDRLQDETKDLRWTLNPLVANFGLVLQLRNDCAVLETVRAYAANSGAIDSLMHATEITLRIRTNIQCLQEKTSTIPYPFSGPAGRMFVNDYAKCKDYHSDPIEMLLREGTAHVENLIRLYYRILARVVTIARQVEVAVSKTQS